MFVHCSRAAPLLRCFQLGVATTQVAEGLAVATQALLARELGAPRSARTRPACRHLLSRSLVAGLIVAGSLSLVTQLNAANVIGGLTTDSEVRAAALGVLPLVLGCQTLKGLAYPVNGALMGGLDWEAAAAAMWAAQISCLAIVALASRSGPLSLRRIWAALMMLFVMQILTGVARVASGTGPWRVLYEQGDAGTEDAPAA